MITQCSIRHLYTLPSTLSSTQKSALIDFAKGFERRRCNHHTLDEPLSTLECYKEVIDPKSSGTNKNRYIVASQDENVRRWCRGIKGVPSVYVKRSVMVMEPMAHGSIGVKEGMERGKLRGNLKIKGEKRKREDEGEEASAPEGVGLGSKSDKGEKRKRNVRGPKEPNPLSVRKPKRQRATSDAVYHSNRGSEELLRVVTNAGRILDEAQSPPLKRKRRRKHGSGHFEDSTKGDLAEQDLSS